MLKKLLIISLLLVVTGCASGFKDHEPAPSGIGNARYQLKKSPCACAELFKYSSKFHRWEKV